MGTYALTNMTDLKRDCRTIKKKIENIGKTRTKKVAKIWKQMPFLSKNLKDECVSWVKNYMKTDFPKVISSDECRVTFYSSSGLNRDCVLHANWRQQ